MLHRARTTSPRKVVAPIVLLLVGLVLISPVGIRSAPPVAPAAAQISWQQGTPTTGEPSRTESVAGLMRLQRIADRSGAPPVHQKPETEADFLMERSPITYVDNVRTPLLVIQGATDPRVVKGESDQLVDKLKSLGREVEYIVFDDEGHGFTKRTNELKAYGLAAEWLEQHLRA